ncbi:MAG: TIGR04540 family protein [Oscillospiraceae bacterium]
MDFQYMQYPTKVKEVAAELIRACNDYKARKIGNKELKEVVLYYASNYPEKLFNGSDINPTVKKIIGQNRIEFLNKVLDGYQQTFFQGGEGYVRKQ